MRGNGFETGELEETLTNKGYEFPSPCGVMGLKQTKNFTCLFDNYNVSVPLRGNGFETVKPDFVGNYSSLVSVPLRGNGFETPVIFELYLVTFSRGQIYTPHFSLNKNTLLTGFQENGHLVTLTG